MRKRIFVRVSDKEHKAFKIKAAKEKKTIQEILMEFVRQFIK